MLIDYKTSYVQENEGVKILLRVYIGDYMNVQREDPNNRKKKIMVNEYVRTQKVFDGLLSFTGKTMQEITDSLKNKLKEFPQYEPIPEQKIV